MDTNRPPSVRPRDRRRSPKSRAGRGGLRFIAGDADFRAWGIYRRRRSNHRGLFRLFVTSADHATAREHAAMLQRLNPASEFGVVGASLRTDLPVALRLADGVRRARPRRLPAADHARRTPRADRAAGGPNARRSISPVITVGAGRTRYLTASQREA